jgi:hypothetical protein
MILTATALFFIFIYLLRGVLSKTSFEASLNLQNLMLYLVGFLILALPEENTIIFTPLLISIGLMTYWIKLRGFQKERQVTK